MRQKEVCIRSTPAVKFCAGWAGIQIMIMAEKHTAVVIVYVATLWPLRTNRDYTRLLTVADRSHMILVYTVYSYGGTCLTVSSNCDTVQGISQFGEYFGINDADFEEGALEGRNLSRFVRPYRWQAQQSRSYAK